MGVTIFKKNLKKETVKELAKASGFIAFGLEKKFDVTDFKGAVIFYISAVVLWIPLHKRSSFDETRYTNTSCKIDNAEISCKDKFLFQCWLNGEVCIARKRKFLLQRFLLTIKTKHIRFVFLK